MKSYVKFIIAGFISAVVFVLGLFYIIFPGDIIPDIIPLTGWLDDAVACIPTLISFLTGVISVLGIIAKVVSRLRGKKAN